jgi:hypothetical protein
MSSENSKLGFKHSYSNNKIKETDVVFQQTTTEFHSKSALSS